MPAFGPFQARPPKAFSDAKQTALVLVAFALLSALASYLGALLGYACAVGCP
jgi:hypothetical protein